MKHLARNSRVQQDTATLASYSSGAEASAKRESHASHTRVICDEVQGTTERHMSTRQLLHNLLHEITNLLWHWSCDTNLLVQTKGNKSMNIRNQPHKMNENCTAVVTK